MKVVSSFEIPEEVAKELSELLTKQGIRERLLSSLVGTEKYEEVENDLVDLIQRIDAIKNLITSEYVPEQYRYDWYTWNYDGWTISKNTLYIYSEND